MSSRYIYRGSRSGFLPGIYTQPVDRNRTLCHFPDVRLVRWMRLIFAVPQKLLADGAGLSVRELARIEAGEVIPSASTIMKLDDAFKKLIHKRLRQT